ncbi:hypothetical protein [Pseudonocardia alni]|uniref:hypothetical protein n=1 Tax=Pseudonocardia alni TaxID=33907 RepID=UPI00340CEE3C
MATEQAALYYGVDTLAAVRGASSGFTVLVLGGLSAPLVGALAPALASAWVVVIGVVAFVVAGVRIGGATSPVLHGAAAAVGAFLLVLPLVLWFSSPAPPAAQLVGSLLAALVVGGAAGALGDRRRGAAG